jgi:hypothetical protein
MADNEHIRDFLKYYCGLPKEPQYAVMLTGLWGGGKTWFIKDFIKHRLPQPERVLYVSLYGAQSIDDIESEFFRLLHPVLGSKPVRVLHRLARGVLKTSINFDLDGDGSADGSVTGGLPSEKMLERISLNANHILVLDDLERCSIPTAHVMGYVNQFIEHGGIKAILIANEAELMKQDSGPNANYGRIKEKLIGRTFEVVPEVSSALEAFAAELPSARVQEVVRANFNAIAQVHECSTYKNLRLVRHALWEFDRLAQSLEPAALGTDALLDDLLALFLVYSLEVHSGSVKPSEIEKLQDKWAIFFQKNDGVADPDQRFHDIRAKYSRLNLHTSLVPHTIWKALLSTGSIPETELNEVLQKSKYFQSENQPTWVKLWYGTSLSDLEFEEVLKVVEEEWAARKYRSLGEVIHVTGLFVRYAKHGIYKKSVDDVVDSAKEYIQELISSGDLLPSQPNVRQSPFDRDSFAGLGYVSMDEEPFRAFLKHIDERLGDAATESLPRQAAELFALVGTNVNLFFRQIVLNNDPDNIYYRTPILHHISPGDFVQRLLEVPAEERRTVAHALKTRYSFQQFNADLWPELEWLRGVVDGLREEVGRRTGKVSSLSLSELIDPHLAHAISQLELANPSKT